MDTSTPQQSGLRRDLSVWQAVGISVALMAPSMAININPQGTAGEVGQATPLAFLLASIAVLFIAYVFVRLCQYYRHAGSVYAFAGATLGPHTGAVAGLGLMGTYIFYACVTSLASGIFGAAFLDVLGVWNDQPWWSAFPIALLALLLACFVSTIPARGATRALLTIEGLTVLLIVVVGAIALVRILVGSPPDDQTFGDASFTLSVFTVPAGVNTSTLFLGIVFGFLSFAGFEAAATLGEEAREPRRDIPRAILGTAIFGGVYFTVLTAIEMMAFGPDKAGVSAFSSSSALMGDIGGSFIGTWVADLITLGACISAFACCLACVVGASRMLFAVSRDLDSDSPLASLNRHSTPAKAVATVGGAVIVTVVLTMLCGAKPFDTFLWTATIGTLLLLVAYLLTTVGCIKLVFVDRRMNIPMWQVVIPLCAVAIILYTLWRNVHPYPDYGTAYFWLPIIVLGWLVAALAFVLAVPGAARKLGRGLVSLETHHEEAARP